MRRSALILLVAVGLGGCTGRSEPELAPEASLAIVREVEARLAAEPSIGAGRVRAEVTGRTVSLYGSVVGFGALQCAIRNAQLVPGVGNVADFLVLERGPREVTCLAPRGAPESSLR